MSFTETPTAATKRHLYQHDSDDTISTAKPRFAAGEREVESQVAPGRVPEQPPRHYWLRALVLIFVPSIVTVYYAVIWVQLLQKSPFDEAVKYRTFSGSLIYYSWFIIGVFGLSWSKFGLVGVEASMLCSHFWGAPNLVALLMHSNGTWSSPSGWINALARREFHRLWCLLTFLSLLPFIALPLSGLVFEISDGYVKTSDTPLVIGRNQTNFNVRFDEVGRDLHGIAPALSAWLIGAPPAIPGLGIIFSGESVDRSEYSVFEKLPNTLPLAESISDLFLAPQADKPVSGTAWGLRFKYECSSVRSASEFTILSQKSASSVIDAIEAKPTNLVNSLEFRTPSGDVFSLGRTSVTDINTQAYYEIGRSAPLEAKSQWAVDRADKYRGDHPGFDAELIFEFAVWQIHMDGLYKDHLKPFDKTVGDPIEGMGSPFLTTEDGSFAVNRTFFATEGDVAALSTENITVADISDLMDLRRMTMPSSDGRMLYIAPPIGVRCVVASDLGTAELDGVTSTFHSFQRANPNFNSSAGTHGSLRFGRTAEAMLVENQYHQHYLSGGLPVTIPGHWENQRRDEWVEPGLTSSREGKILSVASLIPGAGVGYFVLALFSVWAALSAALGLVYGFRKRPADRLDGYSMLRIGADMAPVLIENNEFMSGMPYQDSGSMAAMRCNVSVRGSIRRA